MPLDRLVSFRRAPQCPTLCERLLVQVSRACPTIEPRGHGSTWSLSPKRFPFRKFFFDFYKIPIYELDGATIVPKANEILVQLAVKPI